MTDPFPHFTSIQKDAVIESIADYHNQGKSIEEIIGIFQFSEDEVVWCLKQKGLM